MRTSPDQSRTAFTLVELLVVIAIIGVLAALLLSAANRSEERAKRQKCQNQLRHFFTVAVMYAEDHEGLLARYQDFLKDAPMLCPSDNHHGARGESSYGLFTSFTASSFVFADRTRLEDCEPSSWMLVEYYPFHDLSKTRGFEAGKWRGRFNSLMADGTTRWELLEQ